MNTPEELSSLFAWILRSSLQASVLALLILTAQALLRERVAPRWRHALWLLLVVRLVIPWAPASRWSVFNLAPALAPAAAPAEPSLLAGAAPPEPELAAEPPAALPWASAADASAPRPLQDATTDVDANPASAFDPFSLLAWLWLAGVAVLSGAVLVQSHSLSRLLRGQRAVTDGHTLELLESCKAAMRVRAWLVVVESPGARSPALFGFVRPRLLLPAGAIGTLSESQLRHVFLHELAHLRRGDIALNWLLALLQALHWFNPLLWLAFRRMRGDREMACDAMAMACLSPDEAPDYGRTIVRLLEQFSLPRRLPGLACILEEKNQIKRRILMIAKFRKPSLAWSFAAALLMLVLGGAGLTGAAQTPSPQNEKALARVAAAEKKLAEVKARVAVGKATAEAQDNAAGELKIAQAEAAGDAQGVLKAKLENAQANLKHKQAMFKAGLLPELQLKQAEGRVKIAQAQLSGDKRAAAQAQLELASEVLKSTKTRFDAGLAGQAELAKAEAAVKAAEAALAQAPKNVVTMKRNAGTAPATTEKTQNYTIIHTTPKDGEAVIRRVITHTSATTPQVWMRTITPDGATVEIQPPAIIKRQILPGQSHSFQIHTWPGAPTTGTTDKMRSLEGQQRAIDALKAQRDQTYKALDENIQRMERLLEEQKRDGGAATIQPKIMPRSAPPSHSELKIDSMVPGGGGGMVMRRSIRSGGGPELTISDVDVRPYREGGLFEATIGFKNNSAKPIPLFDVQFYRDEKERAEGVMNGAGPIEPGASFSEASRPFALKEGENKITIQVDPQKKAPGFEKADFRAEIQVTVKDGKIVKKGTSIRQSQGGASRSEYKFNTGSAGTGGGGGSMSFGSSSGGASTSFGSSGGGSSSGSAIRF